jgi:antitoxin (DNA-binding transcriptional repressor) of toxin-antitoxin stability system
MGTVINTKELRRRLPEVVGRVKKGARFTVLYRSRPAFEIVPVDAASIPQGKVEEDSLYRAPALGKSRDGLSARDHDAVLYGK